MPPRTTRRTAAAAAAAAAAAMVVDQHMESGREEEDEDEVEAEVSGGEDSESVSHAAYISDTNVHRLIRQKMMKKKMLHRSNLPHRLSRRSKLP